MGAMSGLLGTAGGASGTGFKAPQGTNIQNPVTPEQLAAGQTGVTGSLGDAGALVRALSGQGGPLAQSGALDNQTKSILAGQGLLGDLTGSNGVGIQNNAVGAQGNLVNALGGVNGAGAMSGALAGQGTLNQGLSGLGGTQLMGGAAQGQGQLNQQLLGLNGAGAVGSAMGQQAALQNQLGGAGGVGAQVGAIGGLQNVLAQQQGLAGQIQGVANGAGPNPAQAMLNQATGQNVANQAALMAGQRGAGANVGLMARQAAQQGASTQQQAAGQAAQMQAQQQLNALQQLGAQQQAMGSTNQNIANIGAGLTGAQQNAINQGFGQGTGAIQALQTGLGQQFGQGRDITGQLQTGLGQQLQGGATATGAQQNALNAQFGQGRDIVGQTQAQIGQNAGMAQNQVGNLVSAVDQNVHGNLGNQGQQLQAVQGVNQANVGMQSNINTGNTGLATTTMGGQQKLIGGGLNAIGGAMGMGGLGNGLTGENGSNSAYRNTGSPKSEGAQARNNAPENTTSGNPEYTGQSDVNSDMGVEGNATSDNSTPQQPQTNDQLVDIAVGNTQYAASGGEIVGPKSSFGQYLHKMAQGGAVHDYRGGGSVNARSQDEKAVKSGNSYSNDRIPAMLSEHEIVLPRTVTQSANPSEAAARFVAAIMAKKRAKA